VLRDTLAAPRCRGRGVLLVSGPSWVYKILGPELGARLEFTSPREVSRTRLWLVSHGVITSGSPPERFEICVSRTFFPRESPGPFRTDRIRPPMTRIHLSPRDWEGSGSPSVGARCPAVTVPPSKGVAVPATQSQGGGPARGSRSGQDGYPV